ncbi:DUF6305 family protein [Pontibacillus marinus]|uniref:DUF6305 domain-containing protein n=1 Tax=Pontibacillus marinus BH030004 = DSM 16465 TaxID=1385511 RepID=A0A0A5HJ07_9BACI|nr:DUF6305 family protein [Pontibacillus marinus]KGX83622.1 hypothetical protein N783_11330 [Pontibacillus marinus BH030004 = DSM 16465]
MKKYSLAAFLLFLCVGVMLVNQRTSEGEKMNTWPNLPAPIGEAPMLITSAGQATEGKVFSFITKDLHLEGDYRPRALASDLYDYSTLVIVAGYSPHGLNQTYRSIKEEKKRVHRLLHEAERSSIPTILIHMGGAARDDEITWSIMEESMHHLDYVIGFREMKQKKELVKLADDYDVPVTLVDEMEDLRTPFNSVFR